MLKLNRLNKFYLLLLAVLTIASCKEKAQLDNLRCEYRVNPIGLDVQCPRFSWEYSAADDMQLAYRIEVAADPAFKDIVWDSGALGTKAERKANPELFPESGRQMVNYLGRDLEPFTKYHWRLTTLMASGAVLQAPVQTFETGMLPGYKWQAQWISDSHDKEFAPAPMLRKVFRIDGELASARLFVSAAAYYKMAVNGTWLNPVALSPDYTDYSKRNQYQVYDVTGLLASGDNALAAVLGNGFYNEIEPVATWDFDKAHWRGRARMIAELHLKYSDGRTEIICTDPLQ